MATTKATKLELIQINARLAAENLELRTRLSVLTAPKLDLKSCANAIDLKEFCRLYCEIHGTRSVPDKAVRAWRAAQGAQS